MAGAWVRAAVGSLFQTESTAQGPGDQQREACGNQGKGGITMSGKGWLVERDYAPEERQAIEEGAKRQGLSTEEMFALWQLPICIWSLLLVKSGVFITPRDNLFNSLSGVPRL